MQKKTKIDQVFSQSNLISNIFLKENELEEILKQGITFEYIQDFKKEFYFLGNDIYPILHSSKEELNSYLSLEKPIPDYFTKRLVIISEVLFFTKLLFFIDSLDEWIRSIHSYSQKIRPIDFLCGDINSIHFYRNLLVKINRDQIKI